MFAIVYDKDTGEINRVQAGVSSKDEVILSSWEDAILVTIPPQRIGKEHKVVNGEIVENYDYLLQQAKKRKKQEIEIMYQQALSEPIEFNGHIFQADAASREVLSNVISAAPDDFETDWYDISNTPVKMTLADLKNLANAIILRGQPLFFKKRQLKDQVDAATTIEEVNAVKW